jgi:predicted MFS family arabinose efflux permease
VLKRAGKKRVLMTGMLLTTIVIVLYGLAESLGVAAALRVFQGVGFGVITTVSVTIAVDFLPASRRGQGIGYFSLAHVIAMAFAPALALFLRMGYGFPAMFFTAAGFSFVAAVILFFCKEPPASDQTPVENNEKSAWWRNLFSRKLIIPAGLLLMFSLSRTADTTFISVFAEASGLLGQLSWYFVIQTATMFAIRIFVGRFADRKGRNWVLVLGGSATLISCMILSFTSSTALMLIGAFFSGLGYGVVAPALQVWMFSLVTPEKRSIASATYYNFTDIGIGVGAALMGYSAEYFGFPVMFRVGACAGILYIIGYIAFGWEKRKKA